MFLQKRGKWGMIRQIRKRDGSLADFNQEKITQAIYKATKAISKEDMETAKKISIQVVSILGVIYKDNRVPTVENVQDLVEKMLINEGLADVAKAYIIYRAQHATLRNTKALFDDTLGLVDNYLNQVDWRVKENSNMGYSLQGLNNFVTSIISSNYWLEKVYPPEIREAHQVGDFHIHDLGQLSVYCCGWDLLDLIINGLKGVPGKIESGPAKHYRSLLGQIVNFFYTLQGEAAGAQAFSNFDTLLAPFIYYDKLDYRDVVQGMQEFIFNLNVPTRVGFQTPFTNITFDLICPSYLKNMAVIIGGKPQDKTYAAFQNEMDMINRAFAEVMMQGDAKGRIFTFPIPTYNITKDFDWDNKNLDLVWEMTAKYGIPYFSNFINSDMHPEDARSMCCRLRLDNRELRKRSLRLVEDNSEDNLRRGGGLFGANPLTGSIGVVTINLPRAAYTSTSEEVFFQKLSALVELSVDSLKIKRKLLENFTQQGLYPYSKFYLRNICSRDKTYWNNHFSTIGIIGMNEACLNLINESIETANGLSLAEKTLNFLKNKLNMIQKDNGILLNLEATPAEGTSYRLANKDIEKFNNIKTAGKNHPYYTNSTHLPVNSNKDLYQSLRHQEKLQSLYSGGTVFHAFLGERVNDLSTCKLLVRRISEQFHLPYFTLTPTFSICPVHGYISGEFEFCPYEHSKEELDFYGIEVG